MNWLRKLFRRNKGWVAGPALSVTVKPGKWTIYHKVSIENGKIKRSEYKIKPLQAQTEEPK